MDEIQRQIAEKEAEIERLQRCMNLAIELFQSQQYKLKEEIINLKYQYIRQAEKSHYNWITFNPPVCPVYLINISE